MRLCCVCRPARPSRIESLQVRPGDSYYLVSAEMPVWDDEVPGACDSMLIAGAGAVLRRRVDTARPDARVSGARWALTRRPGCVTRWTARLCDFGRSAGRVPRSAPPTRSTSSAQVSSYFLIVADLISYARSAGIGWVRRGLNRRLMVAYALGITDIDPIPHGLLFERFPQPSTSMPDIDIDFADRRRGEMGATQPTSGDPRPGRAGPHLRRHQRQSG